MCFWKNLANFVGMKNSIDFLPERKQRDLHELAALIRDEVKDVVMIILYGSYAANTYVERDERRDYGVRTIYMSDYDLLVVTKRRLGERESTVEARVRERFAAGKNDENLPRPQIQENIKEASQMAADNGEKEQELTGQLASYQEQEVQSSEKREQMLQNFAQIEQEMAQLVEENKHFTTPSKFLNEFPVALKAENEKTREELEKMQDCGKQMGVLALNAAIEAGRMGEGGKQ